MAFIDWTKSDADATWVLDTTTKRTGTSSVKCSVAPHTTYLYPTTLHVGNCYVSLYARRTIPTGLAVGTTHVGWGGLVASLPLASTWFHIECYWWYDVGYDTKFGRVLRNGVQVGADSNFGAGAPAPSDILLVVGGAPYWIDDVEIWS